MLPRIYVHNFVSLRPFKEEIDLKEDFVSASNLPDHMRTEEYFTELLDVLGNTSDNKQIILDIVPYRMLERLKSIFGYPEYKESRKTYSINHMKTDLIVAKINRKEWHLAMLKYLREHKINYFNAITNRKVRGYQNSNVFRNFSRQYFMTRSRPAKFSRKIWLIRHATNDDALEVRQIHKPHFTDMTQPESLELSRQFIENYIYSSNII